MKKLIVAAFALITAYSVLAQGTVVFGNSSPLGTSHVWTPSPAVPGWSLVGNGTNDGPAGSTPYSEFGMTLVGSFGTGGKWGSATTFAQLLWANGANQPLSSLQPGGQTSTFRSGAEAGLLSDIVVTIPGLIPDSAAATFVIVAWDNSSGLYPTWTQAFAAWGQGVSAIGFSKAFNVYAIGGSVNTPPYMRPESFNAYAFIPEPSSFAVAGLGLVGLLAFHQCRTVEYTRGREKSVQTLRKGKTNPQSALA